MISWLEKYRFLGLLIIFSAVTFSFQMDAEAKRGRETKKFKLGAKGCGGGWCASAIPRKCGSTSWAKANKICRTKKYEKAKDLTVGHGRRAIYCGPAGGGCHLNKNTKCNRVFTSVTCSRPKKERAIAFEEVVEEDSYEESGGDEADYESESEDSYEDSSEDEEDEVEGAEEAV